MEQAEQAPSTPPVKNRRRWLIISFVIGFVLICTWWYWPRGDARFVGKWDGLGSTVRPTPLELRSNGTGRIITRGYDICFSWRIEGDQMVLGRDRPNWELKLFTSIHSVTVYWLGWRRLMNEIRYDLSNISENSFVIEWTGEPSASAVTLTRIPE